MLIDSLPRQFIEIEGAINLRDFGGYTTSSGRTVRKGKLFRCGQMADMPETSYEPFSALDISVICDLRSHEEVQLAPSPEAPPFECRVHIPIWPGSTSQFRSRMQEEQRHASTEEFTAFMQDVTRELARDHVNAYKQLMLELVSTEKGFLLHCTAGKDRTGFGAAMILTLLGVDRETVLHDYLVSNEATELMQRTRERMLQSMKRNGLSEVVDEGMLQIMSTVRAEYLQAAYDEIDYHYGGIKGYLEEIGITEAEEQALEARLLE